MITDTKTLLKNAHYHYAVGAYNIACLEQFMGLFKGCVDSHAPFLLALTDVALYYSHPTMLLAMIRGAQEIFPDAVFAVHHDHGNEESCYRCIQSGLFSSVMIDASKEDFETNIAITSRVVKAAQERNISVEAELGQIGGTEDHIRIRGSDVKLTDPDKAAEFVERTGVDFLACAIGTSHGAFKFNGPGNLHFDLLAEIQEKIPEIPLVLHGASSVPEDEVRRVTAAGGKLQGAKGVDPALFKTATKMGIAKINIATDSRLIWTRVHREYFQEHPESIDFRVPGKIFTEEFALFVAQKNRQLGSSDMTNAF